MALYLNKETNDRGNYCFLSYKKEDADVLRQIVPSLNFDVWYDYGIEDGTYSWNEAIYTHLVESQAVIFFLSKALLKGGDRSYPYFEYNQAEQDNKKIIVVFLEKIDVDTDVPGSLKFWYQKVTRSQCIGHGGGKSPKELAEAIQNAIDYYYQHENLYFSHNLKKVKPKQLDTNLLSNLPDKHIIYTGFEDTHFSPDMSKICLYDYVNKKYSVYNTDSTDYVLASFVDKHKNLQPGYRLFFSTRNSFIYYTDGKKIYTYNIPKKSWNSLLLKKSITLSNNEHISAVCSPLSGNYTYLILRKNECFTRIIKYNLSTDTCEADWNIAHLKYCSVLDYLNCNQTELILFSDINNELCIFDVQNIKVTSARTVPDFCKFVESYYSQSSNINTSVNNKLSHDGSLYSVEFNGGFEVFNALERAHLCSVYYGQYSDVYLLKNSTMLTYDKNGTVAHTTFDGKMEIMTGEYFSKIPEFDGNIPINMSYDETTGNYIFITSFKNEDKNYSKVIIVDRFCRVIAQSKPLLVPFKVFYCNCRISQDKLFIIFNSEKETIYNYQHSVIYSCDYSRKDK